MKFFTTPFLILISFAAFSRTDPADTTLKGVAIRFTYSASIFPESWQAAPISAQGEQLSELEMQRCKLIMIKALDKYPVGALRNELKGVYFLKSMKFYDVGYGGTNSTDMLYLTDEGATLGYTDFYIEQTFHHEYSSILYRNHPSYFDETNWIKANIPGFDYNDPENGVGAIRNNESSQTLDTVLCKKGFLTQYSLSGMENDINTFAQNMFYPTSRFWEIVDQYPRVNEKMKLFVAFYNKIDPLFTEEYFRTLTR